MPWQILGRSFDVNGGLQGIMSESRDDLEQFAKPIADVIVKAIKNNVSPEKKGYIRGLQPSELLEVLYGFGMESSDDSDDRIDRKKYDFSDKKLSKIIRTIIKNSKLEDESLLSGLCDKATDSNGIVIYDEIDKIRNEIEEALNSKLRTEFETEIQLHYSAEQIICFYLLHTLKNNIVGSKRGAIHKKDHFTARDDYREKLNKYLKSNNMAIVTGNHENGKTEFAKWYVCHKKSNFITLTWQPDESISSLLKELKFEEDIIQKETGLDVNPYGDTTDEEVILKRFFNLRENLILIIENFAGAQQEINEIFAYTEEYKRSKNRILVITSKEVERGDCPVLKIDPLSQKAQEEVFWIYSEENQPDSELRQLVSRLPQAAMGHVRLIALLGEAYKENKDNKTFANKMLREYMNGTVQKDTTAHEKKYHSSLYQNSGQLKLMGHIKKVYEFSFKEADKSLAWLLASLAGTTMTEYCMKKICGVEDAAMQELYENRWISRKDEKILIKIPKPITVSLIENRDDRRTVIELLVKFLEKFQVEIRDAGSEEIIPATLISLLDKVNNLDLEWREELLSDKRRKFSDTVQEFFLDAVSYCVKNGKIDLAHSILEDKIPDRVNNLPAQVWTAIVEINFKAHENEGEKEYTEYTERLFQSYESKLNETIDRLQDCSYEECDAYMVFYRYMLEAFTMNLLWKEALVWHKRNGSTDSRIQKIIREEGLTDKNDEIPYLDMISKRLHDLLRIYTKVKSERDNKSKVNEAETDGTEYMAGFLNVYFAENYTDLKEVEDCMEASIFYVYNMLNMADKKNIGKSHISRRDQIAEFDLMCTYVQMHVLHLSWLVYDHGYDYLTKNYGSKDTSCKKISISLPELLNVTNYWYIRLSNTHSKIQNILHGVSELKFDITVMLMSGLKEGYPNIEQIDNACTY